MYIYTYIYVYIYILFFICTAVHVRLVQYTRSPSQDFRLFGPRPLKILATTYDKKKQRFLSNPDPGENLVSGNLVMETGCMKL